MSSPQPPQPTEARMITWGMKCHGVGPVPCEGSRRMPTELQSGLAWWAVARADGSLRIVCAQCFAKLGAAVVSRVEGREESAS